MRLFDTTLPDDDARRLSLSLSVAELAQLYTLIEAAEDAGLDESAIGQHLRVAILRLEGNLTREIDRILPAIDALRVTGEPPPDRVDRLAGAAARLNDCMAI